jgi:hypothetical protein
MSMRPTLRQMPAQAGPVGAVHGEAAREPVSDEACRLRRRIASNRQRPLAAAGPTQVWAYDFVFDACTNGQ